jgi:hypothetical protein
LGIDVSLVADLPSAVEGRPVDLNTVLDWANPVLDIPAPLDRLAIYTLHDDLLEYALLPIEEPVCFRIERTGLLGRKQRLVVSARTSSAGPGYHAALIAGLDRMAVRGGLKWRETEDEFDEAGYFANRDFDALQAAHRDFFEALSKMMLEWIDDGRNDIAVSLPLELSSARSVIAEPVATPMGPRDGRFFEQPDPARHFPWWPEALGPDACSGIATALLWCNFAWCAPLAGRDREVGEVALALVEQVAAAGARQAPPVAPAAISALLENEDQVVPATEGIGYRRRLDRQVLPGGWSVGVPGWYVREPQDDGAIAFSFAGREVWVTIFPFPGPLDAAERDGILASTRADIALHQDGLVGRAEVKLDDPGTGGPEMWFLQGTLVATESLARITIVFPTPDHRPWAEEVFRSVAPSG